MQKKIIIIDFGSQFTQLIARTLRELNIYCEIHPFDQPLNHDNLISAIILSGSPASISDKSVAKFNWGYLPKQLPLLGICFGAQWLAKNSGGTVQKSSIREFGRAQLIVTQKNKIFSSMPNKSMVWMSHSDTIISVGSNCQVLAQTNEIPIAAFCGSNDDYPIFYGIQFHPEVFHSQFGKKIIENFVLKIAKHKADFYPQNFIKESILQINQSIPQNSEVLMALSGGVDSTVAAVLINKAIGSRLRCFFVDNGLLRLSEYSDVLNMYQELGLKVKGIKAKQYFWQKLKGVTIPEHKRKIIGKAFVDIFNKEANSYHKVHYLGQGTIYPDLIESNKLNGLAHLIKSHHNVGGLPKKMKLKLIEPLKYLFKDEVRKIGKELNIPENFINRHPFPGPGLAIRIIGEVNQKNVQLLQQVDNLFIKALKESQLYDKVWQAAAILLPIKSVGVMGDERTYEKTVVLRAVTSTDGMTADWAELPTQFLKNLSNNIVNNVKGINRVVYDISSKPPSTIEWE